MKVIAIKIEALNLVAMLMLVLNCVVLLKGEAHFILAINKILHSEFYLQITIYKDMVKFAHCTA